MRKEYKKLEKLYYSSDNIQLEYKNRIESPATFVTNLKINLYEKKRKNLTKNFNIFYVNLLEHIKLQEEILSNSKKIQSIIIKMPRIVLKNIMETVLINEVLNTNKIEGIYSTKAELYSSIKEKKNKKKERKEVLLDYYFDIYNKNFQSTTKITTVSDIRKIYDEIFIDKLENEDYCLDGKFFRQNNVNIENPLGEIIHSGVNGEENIISSLNDLILFMNDKNIPFLLKAAITHFFIEYVHPFYDGNGRFGRYIFSLYLARKLDILSALSFSYSVSNNKEKYYKNFREVEDMKNFGEITFFVEYIYKILITGQESIIELLLESSEKIERALKILEELRKDKILSTKKTTKARHFILKDSVKISQNESNGTHTNLDNSSFISEKYEKILFIYIQDYFFNKFDKISNIELAEELSLSQQTINTYTKFLEEKKYLERIKSRPLTYQISEKILNLL